MFPRFPCADALRATLLVGLGLWLAPLANAQDRGMVRTSSSSVLDGPTTYVLAVGVADFKHLSTDFDLRYAEADASAFTEGLASALGDSIPQEQITLLVGRAATLESVSIALRETLAAADENDTVILFFSTHGVLSGDEGYLLTWDTTPNERLPYTSLPTKDIVSAVNRSRAGHVLLFTDACHAGITGAGTKGASVPSFDPSTIQVDHRSFFNQASSTIMQPSLEGPEYCGGHGAYTCALLMAMQGAVDRDSDGIVSLRELQIYVPPIVDSLTKGQQSPETKGRFDSQHVFVGVPPTSGDVSGSEEVDISFADVALDQMEVMEGAKDGAYSAGSPFEEPNSQPRTIGGIELHTRWPVRMIVVIPLGVVATGGLFYGASVTPAYRAEFANYEALLAAESNKAAGWKTDIVDPLRRSMVTRYAVGGVSAGAAVISYLIIPKKDSDVMITPTHNGGMVTIRF